MLFAKILRKLRLNKLFYKISIGFSHAYVPVNEDTIGKSYLYLSGLNKDKGTSCIIDNHINENPLYDLLIIVPAYNVEKYIVSCIDSIVNQRTNYKIQVKIVDDGSTDNTQKVIQKYSYLNNVIIITKQNGGQASACNLGLNDINARYVMFVDADDMLKEGSINKLLDLAHKHNDIDVIEGQYVYFSGNSVLGCSNRESGIFEDWTKLLGYQWLKIYKSYLFNGIGFPEGYWHSDTVGHFVRYQLAKKIMIIPDVVYMYRRNKTGVSFTARKNYKTIDSLWITKQLLNDKRILGQALTLKDYHIFLNQIAHNMYRILCFDKDVQKYEFVISKSLRDIHFKDFSCRDANLSKIEFFLDNNDWGGLTHFCKYIY